MNLNKFIGAIGFGGRRPRKGEGSKKGGGEIRQQPDNSNLAFQASLSMPSTLQRLKEEILERFNFIQSEIPDCYDKSISLLQLHFALESINSDSDDKMELKLIDDLTDFLGALKKQLDDDSIFGGDVQTLHTMLSKYIETNNKMRIIETLQRFADTVRPLDLDFTMKLIEQAKRSAIILHDRDVVLLLGGTGVGKSTTIQFLSGSTMEKAIEGDLEHIRPVKFKFSALESVVASPFGTSETKAINAVSINLEELGFASGESIILCDSPGFGDTAGAAVDIANGIGLAITMRQCRTIKPLIVIGKLSIGERMEGILKLSKILTTLFGSIESNLKSFTYVFTKYSKNESMEIHKRIKQKLKTLDATDIAFVELIEDIVKKTEAGALIIDPVNDKPDDLLRRILGLEPVENPKDVICNFISPESVDLLERQLHKHEASIRCALKREQVPQVIHKLSQLKGLMVATELSVCAEKFNGCIEELRSTINATQLEAKAAVERVFMDGNLHVEHEIQSVGKCFKRLSALEVLRTVFMEDLSIDVNLGESAALQVGKAAYQLQERFLVLFSSAAIGTHDDSVAVVDTIGFTTALCMIEKLSDLRTTCRDISMPNSENIDTYYETCCKCVHGYWESAVELARLSAIAIDVKNFKVQMDFIGAVEVPFERYLSSISSQSDSKHAELSLLLESSLQEHTERVQKCLQQDVLTEEHAKSIHLYLDLVREAAKSPDGGRHYNPACFQSSHNAITEIACRRIRSLCASVHSQVSASEVSGVTIDFDSIRRELTSVDALIQHLDIKFLCDDDYQSAIGELRLLVFNCKGKLSNAVKLLLDAREPDFDKCTVWFKTLERAYDCFEKRPAIYNGEFQSIMSELDAFNAQITAEATCEGVVSISNQEFLGPLLSQVSCAIKLFGNLSIPSNVGTDVGNQLIHVLKNIRLKFAEHVDLSNLDLIRSSFSFVNLVALSRLPGVESEADETNRLLSEFVDAQDMEISGVLTLCVSFLSLSNTVQAEERVEKVSLASKWLTTLKHTSDYYDKSPPSTFNRAYEKLMSILPKRVAEEWYAGEKEKAYLLTLHTDIVKGLREAAETQDVNAMYQLLGLLECFQPFDIFLESRVAPRLFELRNSLSVDMLQIVTNIRDKIRIAVTNQSYYDLASLIGDLRPVNDSTQGIQEDAHRILYADLKQRVHQISVALDNNSGSQPTAEALLPIIGGLRKLIEAENTVFMLFDNFQSDELKLSILNIHSSYQRWAIKLVDKVNLLTNQLQLKECLEVLREMKVIGELCIGLPMSEDVQNFIPSETGEKILQFKSGLDQLRDSEEKEMREYFKQVTLCYADLATNFTGIAKSVVPKHVHNALREGGKIDSTFDYEAGKLVKVLTDQITIWFDAVKSQSIDALEQAIGDFQNSVELLPEIVVSSVQAKIVDLKSHIENSRHEHEREMRECSENGDFEKNIQNYLSCLQSNSVKYAGRYKLVITDKIRFDYTSILTNLQSGEILVVLSRLPKLYQNWKQYLKRSLDLITKDWEELNKMKAAYNQKVANFGGPVNRHDGKKGSNVNKVETLRRSQALGKEFEDLKQREMFFDWKSRLIDDRQTMDICESVKKEITATIAAIVKGVMDIPQIKPETLRKFCAYFSKLSAICDTCYVWPSLATWLERKMVRPLDALSMYPEVIKRHQELYENALKSFSVKDLARMMEHSKELSSYLDEIYSYSRTEYCKQKVPDLEKISSICARYDAMSASILEKLNLYKDLVLNSFVNNPRTRSLNELDRDEFYGECSQAFTVLKEAKLLSDHVQSKFLDFRALESDCRVHFNEELANFEKQVERYLLEFPNAAAMKEFSTTFDNFRSISEKFADSTVSEEAKTRRDNVDRNFRVCLTKFSAEKLLVESADDQIIEVLISLKSASLSVSQYKKLIDDHMEVFLAAVKKQSVQRIGQLGLMLEKNENKTISMMIINETNALKGYSLMLRNEKTLRIKSDEVLKLLRGDEVDEMCRRGLKAHYDAFEKEYWHLVQQGLTSLRGTITDLPNLTRELLRLNCDVHEKIRHILTHVCAYWTLDNLQSSGSEAKKDLSDKTNLLQPHAAQIIAVFRLLGVEREGDVGRDFAAEYTDKTKTSVVDVVSYVKGLKKQLAQVLTGEGKSFILAMLAITLAILGCSVKCACYSEYLSRRDHEGFAKLFQVFGVSTSIKYGTFHKLCEEFINQSGNIRDLVISQVSGHRAGQVTSNSDMEIQPSGFWDRFLPKQLVTGLSESWTSLPSGTITERERSPKVLLIDEVDVFFSKEFYGNIYRPVAKLNHPVISKFLEHVWSIRERKDQLFFGCISKTSEFAALTKLYPDWEDLISESVRSICYDVQSFDKPEYEVVDDKIGYKDSDGISFDICYGYKTLFAYFKEAGTKPPNITRGSLEAKLALTFDCGSFSYAEIPKQFDSIIGVTGTLETLLPPELDLIEGVYNIRKKTFLPSVYGLNQLSFSPDSSNDCHIEPSSYYYSALVNEIKSRRESLNDSTYQRAVLVFFETTPKLLDFYHSNEFACYRDHVQILTESVSVSSKESIIRSAVTTGAITLLNRVFGRGTDFYCYDDKLINNGGIHVIQTFVSEVLSEETQIKGRTARQGNKGSFSMVLMLEELEKFDITGTELTIMKNSGLYYTTLNRHRCQYFERQYPESMRFITSIKESHDSAVTFLDNLLNKRSSAIRSFLLTNNKAPVVDGGRVRTLCLLDATGSMTNLLVKAKNTVQEMFRRLEKVLESKRSKVIVELRVAFYRNYSSSADKLLEFSGWELNPNSIRTFLEAISVSGGMGNEAIEVALQFAADTQQEDNWSQCILIGDMGPNTREEVTDRRDGRGETYWSETRFSVPTFYQDEINRIKKMKLPVHCFWVAPGAETSFREIAAETEARASYLDINSDQGADDLTDLLSEEILRRAGGDELVSEYTAMFGRGGRGFV